ncbi:hypothetical protein tloyanaT_32230 [Thalassotalea loyana]|uniref:HEPN AbiU2-like domain-containing protein n=1 Tax=Thalassotalea loyana TaxID=280483 RepID=A0ABQ6HFU9_9GAMM|nr:hypothetical protein [Thalassotalea loyana]GLX86970.1 hypothetical protein tloyanaT_32230 [Thalassotalea loyana]
MKRLVEITDNSFFSIFSDAVLLYDLASSESNEHVRRTLSTSSILSVNYALEAAANSFFKSVDINSKISAQVDRFSTLDKFDFILQWHKDISLPRGDSETQIVKKLIEQRNQLVHPKVKVIKQDVMTSPGDDTVAYYHKADDSDSSEKCNITKMSMNSSSYSPEDSLIALKSLVNFLNKFVEDWWGIDVPTSEILLMKSWNGSIQANPIMYDQNELKVVLKHNDKLNIRFAGLYGILDGSVQ